MNQRDIDKYKKEIASDKNVWNKGKSYNSSYNNWKEKFKKNIIQVYENILTSLW